MSNMPYMGAPVKLTGDGRAQCSLCLRADGCTHAMGGCTHKAVKDMCIRIHDEAELLIRQAIAHGTHGAAPTLMDAGMYTGVGMIRPSESCPGLVRMART